MTPAFAGLAGELGDLKRLRDARGPRTVAERLFAQAWGALCGGEAADDVAMATTAAALAATRLAGLDHAMLLRVGVTPARAVSILREGMAAVGEPVDAGLLTALRAQAGRALVPGVAPGFVAGLEAQPRAGATCPGKPRIVLEPPESHADHSLLVAVLGVLLSPVFEADAATLFLIGLSHHLHNAVLPDAGFTGEMLLGDELGPVMARLFDEGYAQMPPRVANAARAAMAQAGTADTAEGRAFNAADVIDRVSQMRHYEQVAQFRASMALDDLNLVHEGPVQAFHFDVLRACGLS